jgi:hypothetical protein
MTRIIIYYNFIIVSIMVVTGFTGAQTTPQLITAILFFPLGFYFLLQIIPRQNRAIILPEAPKDKKKKKETGQKIEKLKKEGYDFDRRSFLKLIGSAGVTVFLFSLFTKRAQAAFFGSVPGPGTVALKDTAGNQIDPAVKQPTDGYKINQLDDSTPAYYGFTNKDGNWFIMKEDSSGNYRYANDSSSGESDFPTAWTDRALHDYYYFDNANLSW